MITGATDGIGLALARQYAELGTKVVLTGRKPIGELPSDLFNELNYCRVDHTEPGSEAKVLEFLADIGARNLDLAFLNAGTGWYGPLDEQPEEEIRRLVRVNLTAPIALSQVLFRLLEEGRGKLVLIGSVIVALSGLCGLRGHEGGP